MLVVNVSPKLTTLIGVGFILHFITYDSDLVNQSPVRLAIFFWVETPLFFLLYSYIFLNHIASKQRC